MKLTDFTVEYELNYVVEEIFMDCLSEFGSSILESIEDDCKYKDHIIRGSDGKKVSTSGFSLNLSGLQNRVKTEADLNKLIAKIDELDEKGVFVKNRDGKGITPCQKAIEVELSHLFNNDCDFSFNKLLDDIKYSLTVYIQHAAGAKIPVPVFAESISHTDLLMRTTILVKVNEAMGANMDLLVKHTLVLCSLNLDTLTEGCNSMQISKVVKALQDLEKMFDKHFDKLKIYIKKNYNDLKNTGLFLAGNKDSKECSPSSVGSCGMAFLDRLNTTIKNYRERFMELNK